MKKQAKVTIIIPNYNSSKYLDNTINSVINQTYDNWQLIIVDDFSDSETKKILEKYNSKNKIKIIYLKENKGAAYCRNLALKMCQSEYVAFLDSDDVWKKNKLEKQLSFMKKNNYNFTYTSYGILKGDIGNIDDIEKMNLNYIIPKNNYSFESFTKDTTIATSTMIIKSEIAEKYSFTDTEICEDYFYKCSILKELGLAYCLNEPLTLYRVRKNSLQSSKMKNFYWIWKINKLYNNFNFFKNFLSLLFISINSLRKYGLK